jgi:hypothetical protein
MRELDMIFTISFELPVIKRSEPLKSMHEPVVKQEIIGDGLDSFCFVKWT